MSTDHNLSEEKGERNRAEARLPNGLPLGQTGSISTPRQPVRLHEGETVSKTVSQSALKVDSGRIPSSSFLLSLDAHKHVDDCSGTLGGVRKVHISALQVTSP